MFEDVIKHYPDFPVPGIDFIDVLPFLHDKAAFNQAIRQIDAWTTAPNVATVEARGFLFGAPLLSVSDRVQTLVPFRKKGKLPHAEGDLVRVEIEKEYGSDELYYRLSDFAACVPTPLRPSATFPCEGEECIEVTIIDDLLATGGTVDGIVRSLQQQTIEGRKLRIKEFIFLVELPALGGRKLLEPVAPVHSLLSLEGVE